MRPRLAVDVLVVIDDSASMGEEAMVLQDQLRAIARFYEIPGWFDYRIAVTSTDVGNPQCDPATSDEGALLHASCREHLENFVIGSTIEGGPTDLRQEACLDDCQLDRLVTLPTGTSEDAELRSRPWIENIGGVRNLPSDVEPADALGCLGALGISGCNFESPLEAARRAVIRSFDPEDPAYGFLRPDVPLFVLIVTDEIDCSFREEHADIFEPGGERVFWADPSAELPTSAVCWHAAVECQGGPETYEGCRSVDRGPDGELASAQDAVLVPAGEYASFFAALEQLKYDGGANPRLPAVFVHVVGGFPEHHGQGGGPTVFAEGDPEVQEAFGIGPACANDVGVAYPALRLDEVAAEFSFTPESRSSICDADWTGALACVPSPFGRLRPWCYQGCAADSDAESPGLQPDCTVIETSLDAMGYEIERALPRCAEGEDTEGHRCWIPVGEPNQLTGAGEGDLSQECIELGANLEFRIVGAEPGACFTVTCTTSEHPSADCPNLAR